MGKMKFLILAMFTVCATDGEFKIGDHLNIPPEELFDAIIKYNKAGLRAGDAEEEAKLDLAKLFQVMEKEKEVNDYSANDDAVMHELENLMKVIAANASLITDMGYDDYNDVAQELISNKDSETNFVGRCLKIHKRSLTQAGYTHDTNTCQIYNDNLKVLWQMLSKHINSSARPSSQALHNIALIIKAYLEHQHGRNHPEEPIPVNREPISDIISKIEMLLAKDDPPKNIYELVVRDMKTEYGNDATCENINKDSLLTSIDLAYQNYLENSRCRNEGDSKVLRQNNANLFGNYETVVNKPNANRSMKSNDMRVDIHGMIDSKTEDIFGMRHWHGIQRHSNIDGEDKLNSFKELASAKPLNTLLPRNSLRECEKYATRRFINVMRSIIDRYTSQSECKLDATLRSGKTYYDYKRPYHLPLVSPFKYPINKVYREYTSTTYSKQNGLKNPVNNIFYDSLGDKSPILIKINKKTNNLEPFSRWLDKIQNDLQIELDARKSKEMEAIDHASYQYNRGNFISNIIGTNFAINNKFFMPASFKQTYATTVNYNHDSKSNNLYKPSLEDNTNLYNILYEDYLRKNMHHQERKMKVKKKILDYLHSKKDYK